MSGFQGTGDNVVAGSSFESIGHIMVPASTDTSALVATFELLDANGAVYAVGTSASVDRRPTQDPNRDSLEVRAFIHVPSSINAIPRGSKYQVVWTVRASGLEATASELVTIVPILSDDIGAQDVVEFYGGDITFQAVLPSSTPAILSVYNENTLMFETPPLSPTSSSHVGYNYDFTVNTAAAFLRPSLEPYTVMWDQDGDRQAARVWIGNPSMISALREFNMLSNRLKRESRLHELTLTPTDLLGLMKTGGDKFNATGLYTNFNFTNAKGVIRYWWLMCSQSTALRMRFLEEAEASFDFSGQAVTLAVDITGHLDSLASNIEGQIESQLVPLKKQLHKRGILDGDGSHISFVARTRGATGLTTSPVSGANLSLYGVAGGKGVIAIRR